MIRPATHADIPAMLDLGAQFHAYSGLSEIAYDPDAFRATLEAGIGSESQAYFVVESGGVLRGMTGGIVYPSYFNRDALAGQEMFWWCDNAEGVRLYRALEQWAISKGCKSFTMVAISDQHAERMDKLYRRMGYRPVEHHYIKGL